MKKNTFYFYYPVKKINIIDSFNNNETVDLLEVLDNYLEKHVEKIVNILEDSISIDNQDDKHYISLAIIQNLPVYNNTNIFSPDRIYIANINILLDHNNYLPTFEIPLDNENFKYKQFIRDTLKNNFSIREKNIKSIKKIFNSQENTISSNFHNYLVYIEPGTYGYSDLMHKRVGKDGEYYMDSIFYLFSPPEQIDKLNIKKILEILLKNKNITKTFIYGTKNSLTDRDILESFYAIV